jgi:hypothetical protein
MRSLGIRGVMLLVVALAFATPALARQSTEASGNVEITALGVDPGGNLVAEVNFSGTFEGTLTHTFANGRAGDAVFEGCVDGQCGTLTMRILLMWGDESIPGFHGRWVILTGADGLETLRGEGTFVLKDGVPPSGPYGGWIHFDPE